MKAATIERFNTPARIHDIEPPQLEDNGVLLRITAAGVNPIDYKIRDGQGGERAFPLTLGLDFAGVVERVGSSVTRVKAGDRVFGTARDHGSFAEFTEIRDGQQNSPFTQIPDAVSDAQAAAMPIPVLTALASIEACEVHSATQLLVLGGAGAVGSAAIQLARYRGAHVTAVVKPGQEAAARASGAVTVVASDGDVIAAIQAAHAEPFDAIIDLISDGEKLKTEVPLVKKNGVILTTIHVADEAWFQAQSIRAVNMAMPDSPQSSAESLDLVAGMVADGELSVDVAAERALGDANDVLDGMKAGTISGKVILRP